MSDSVRTNWDSTDLPVKFLHTSFSRLEAGGEEPIDDGILGWVNLLRYHGIETCQSCEGGNGHAYPEPTIEFFGDRFEGWYAASIAMRAGVFEGLRAAELRRTWHLSDEPEQPVWTLVLSRVGVPFPWWEKGATHHSEPPA